MILIAALLFGLFLHAQDTLRKKNSFIAYPIAFYLPETGFGGGSAMAYYFHIDKRDDISPSSQIQLGFAYTQKGQVIFSLPFNFYWDERKNTLLGEIAYNDFSYNFYGTGEGNVQGFSERYKVRFPLFRLSYLRKIKESVYFGARWWYEDYRIHHFEESPWLTSGNFTGGRGGVSSGPGLIFLYDTRDNIYFSSKGKYFELSFQDQANHWGSEFAFQRYRFDFRQFTSLSENWSLASMLFGDFLNGSVPFSQLASIGGEKRMRGFYPGRYRDMNMLLYQGELRGIVSKRWGANAFWNYALLSDKLNNFSFRNDHLAAGLGLRFAFDKEKKTNIRLDAAVPIGSGAYKHGFTSNPFIFYLTLNEAF